MAIRLAPPSLTERAQPGIGRATRTTSGDGGAISGIYPIVIYPIGIRPTSIHLKGLGVTLGWGVN